MRRPVRARAAFGDWWKPDPIQCPDGQRWDDAESKCVLDKGLIPRFADWIQEHVDFSNKEAGPQWEGHVCPGQSQWDVSARVCVDPQQGDGPPAQPKCPQGMVYQTVDPVGCVPEKADPSRQPPSSASGYGPLVLAVGVAVLAAYLISQQNDADAGLVPFERYLDNGLRTTQGARHAVGQHLQRRHDAGAHWWSGVPRARGRRRVSMGPRNLVRRGYDSRRERVQHGERRHSGRHEQ